jgi:hypothetical protein
MLKPAGRPETPDFDPHQLRGARLRRLHEYWDQRRAGRTMPARADLDPVEMAFALGYVTLHDVLPEGGYRFRVDATQTAAMFGIDMTGRTLDQYPIPEIREMIRRSLDAVAASARPLRSDLDYGSPYRHWSYERLILPLSADGTRVDMLMSAVDIAPMPVA